MGRTFGFTLWELLWTLAIAAVAFGAGVPAFQTLVLDARLTTDVNAWVLAVQLARSEAFKRGRPVIACLSEDLSRCGDDTPESRPSWIVFVNLDEAYPPRRSPMEPLLYAHAPELAGTIVSNRAYYEFRPGRRSTNGTTVFCDRRGTPAARAVIVSYTGRPRVDNRDGDGRPLRCAQVT
jgi:type IV fimbrial biogenesis protein FimT